MDVDDQPIYQIRQRGQLKDVATIIILGTNAQEVLAEEHDECGFESVEADYMVDDVAMRSGLEVGLDFGFAPAMSRNASREMPTSAKELSG
ncbi:MAG: hypothetical protein Q9179_006940 [Wetmoreana sp. 5 TL-2023]